MSNDSEGFIQSGELPTNRAPAILNRAYCKGWHDAIANVLEHLESQKSTWGTTGIIPEHLIKHIMGNVQALQVNPPPSPSEAVERDAALEEAAKLCERRRGPGLGDDDSYWGPEYARRIRELKRQSDKSSE